MPNGHPRHDERDYRDEQGPVPTPAPREIEPAERAQARRMKSLWLQLEATIRGEVRFDDAWRAIYSTDASNYRYIPLGVVVPRDAADVMEAVRTARQLGVPITHRGAGTSLAGQATNGALVIDHSKYFNAIKEIDPDRRPCGSRSTGRC